MVSSGQVEPDERLGPGERGTLSQDVAAVVRRYRRTERLLTGGLLVTVVGAVGGAVVALPFVAALVVGLGAAVAVRAPVFETGGSATLRTDADPETIRADFVGATPPVLAFQWSVADSVETTTDGGRYELSSLFGLWSVTMETETDRDGVATGEVAADEGATLDLRVTAGRQDLGSDAVTVRESGGATVVDVSVTSDRRFGLRRLPQWLAAERHREAALAAQGYEVLERDVRPRVSG